MTYQVSVSFTGGSGRLARRLRAMLFVAEFDPATTPDMIELFLQADDERVSQVIADYVLSKALKVPPFALVTWPLAPAGASVQLTVLGDVPVTTDLPSLPHLTGAGSSTWVEHRVPRNPETAEIRSGAASQPATDLGAGVAPAGGFTLQLHDRAVAPEPIEADAAPAASSPRADTAGDEQETAAVPATPTESPQATTPATDGLAVLRAMAGTTEPTLPASTPAAPSTHDDEHEHPAAVAESATRTPIVAERSPDGPPPFPGSVETPSPAEADRHDDDEATLPRHAALRVAEPDGDPPADAERLTHARLCGLGHPNPTHVERCRACGVDLDTGSDVVTVEQPVLALVELPDGDFVEMVDTVVVGRKPTLDQAQIDHGALAPIAAPQSVSRTHVRFDVDGWTLTVTDCGSRGGTALVAAGDDEPVALTPWVAHEISGGDTVYLGGPTGLRIRDVAT